LSLGSLERVVNLFAIDRSNELAVDHKRFPRLEVSRPSLSGRPETQDQPVSEETRHMTLNRCGGIAALAFAIFASALVTAGGLLKGDVRPRH
jgi:hypothetical protein